MLPTEKILHLTKFDVAERQLLLAIRLFFDEEDEVSIHTLTEAASQVLRDIGKEKGAKSLILDNDLIRPEKKAEWLRITASSRNFFKHADRDANSIHKFNASLNEMHLYDAVNIYASLKNQWVPETLVFFAWFIKEYPDLLDKASPHYTPLAKIAQNGSLSDGNKKICKAAITSLKSGALTLPIMSSSSKNESHPIPHPIKAADHTEPSLPEQK